MATDFGSAPPPRPGFLGDALVGGAVRLLLRPRRRRGLLLLVACGAAGTGVLLGGGGAGGSNRAVSATSPRVAVLSRPLPALGRFPSLSVAGGRLIVADTDDTAFAGGRVLGTCTAVSIAPVSLRVISVSRGNCGDPALYGRRILPVVYQVNSRPGRGWGSDELGIRVARADRAAPGGYVLGPPVVDYPDCSDCRAQVIYGPDALWVYAPITSPGAPGELVRISTATGMVSHRWAIPEMTRALLATDADGLWFAPGIETCCAGPRSSWRRESELYYVAPSASVPLPKVAVGLLGASWLVASGHTVWIEARTRVAPDGRAALWRLDRPTAEPALVSARAPDVCGDLGERPATVLGARAIGIYCVAAGAGSQHVVRLDPRGDGAMIVASVPTLQQYASPDSAAVLNGSYYFLEPPSTIPGRPRAVIYRITLPGHGPG